MAKEKVASWYWNITAILTPFVLIVTIAWLYYSAEVNSYQTQARRTVEQLKADQAQMEALVNDMNKVAEATGFDPGGVLAAKTEAAANAPRPDPSVGGQERTQPQDKQSPTLRAYLEAEREYYGDAAAADGYVHDYAAARAWIERYEQKLRRYLAYKARQGYRLRPLPDGVTSTVDLARPNSGDTTVWNQPITGAVEPADPIMQAPVKMTLEMVFREQLNLLRDLLLYNKGQYVLLYAEASGTTESRTAAGQPISIGSLGETEALKRVQDQQKAAQSQVASRLAETRGTLSRVAEDIRNAAVLATSNKDNLERKVLSASARIDILQSDFATEAAQHREDAERFRQMLTRLPRIKAPIRLEKSEPDGDITYSDFARGVCHINLGSADGVRQGQRFEVWRLSGKERDEMIGVIEIVRLLSPRYSLATVLSLVNENNPVRTSDKIVSQIWHNGRFLTIAMHGEFEPPAQSYTKDRLKELLEQSGATVVDKVQPGVDQVILGSSLIADEWYRAAQADMRFSSVREESIRLYVDPR